MESPRVLFFTRGRGRGHALPDLAILDELRALSPGLSVQFASYSTGRETLAQAGHQVIDLEVEDGAPYLELLIRCARIIREQRPDVVVSHEEFAALPAAKIYSHPAIFLVDFFPPFEPWKESLRHADRIVFIERRGIFPEPPELKGRICYAGPVVRPLQFTRADRVRARGELGLTEAARVIAVVPGAWATEARAPIFPLVSAAFRALPYPDKVLVWIAGADQEDLSRAAAGSSDVRVLRQHSPIERVMVASDLVITKANRGTTIELSRLGIPSISLSHGINPIDEMIIPRIHGNLALNMKAVDGAFLVETMRDLLEAGAPPAAQIRPDRGAATAAAEIARFLAQAPPHADPALR
jgi:UDP-N-acetylglucosamine:LPS N-acetylglucosamine transferase